MGKIANIIDKLKQATNEAQTQELLVIVNRYKNQLIDLNLKQLYEGRNAKGFSLGRYRSDSYAEFKNRMNPKPGLGVPDLNLTGAFYQGFYLEATSFPISLNSTDLKTGKLAEQYEEAFGIDTENLEKFRTEIKPDVQTYYCSLFKL